MKRNESHPVTSDSLQPQDYTVHGILQARVGSLSLLQGVFPTQGLNSGLPHCRQILYQLSHREAQTQFQKKNRWCSTVFFLHASIVKRKNLCMCIWRSGKESACQEMQVLSLSQEDPLEEVTATLSSILAWRILWTEVPRRLQSMGSLRVGDDWADWALFVCIYIYII